MFLSNKLSLNIETVEMPLYIYVWWDVSRTYFCINQVKKKTFHFFTKIDDKQLRNKMNRINYINFTWNEHIKCNENKIVKNLGLLCKAKHYLNKGSLLVIYYSFTHTYINYGDIA